MRKNEKWIKLTGTVLCEIFTVCTIIMLLAGSEPDRLLLAFATLLLAALPMLLEKLLHCRISLPIYIFALAYAIGPMLGHCWKLYYTVPVWDKLLHISGGVMFAILGAYCFVFKSFCVIIRKIVYLQKHIFVFYILLCGKYTNLTII